MKNLFEEKQRFTQWWLWAVIVPPSMGILLLFGHALVQQIVLGKPWGDSPMSDDKLIAISLFAITGMLLMLMVFFTSVLEIVIDKSGVQYKYFPVIREWRRIEREQIETFTHRKEIAMRYGVQRDLSGNKTINVKGSDTVEITMNDGKRIRLGTQRPQEFVSALTAMKGRRFE